MSNLFGLTYKGVTILDWDSDREGMLVGRMRINRDTNTDIKFLFENVIDGLVSEPPLINPNYMTIQDYNGFCKLRSKVKTISLNVKDIEGLEMVVFIMGKQ